MTPPHDPAAELACIGIAIASRYPRPDLTPDDFYVPAHRRLWAALAELQPPIRPADLNEIDRATARKAANAWTAADVNTAPARVKDCARARTALALARELDDAARAVDLEAVGHLARALVVL